MSQFTRVLAVAGILGLIGLTACERKVVDIDTPAGGIEVEEDGDINITE